MIVVTGSSRVTPRASATNWLKKMFAMDAEREPGCPKSGSVHRDALKVSAALGRAR